MMTGCAARGEFARDQLWKEREPVAQLEGGYVHL
jgi:hypothetical protein